MRSIEPWQEAEAPPEGEVSRTIRITEFPAPGLQYDTLYEIRLWVRNRSGLSRAANAVTVEMVPLQEQGEEQYGTSGEPEQEQGKTIDLRKEGGLPGVRRSR
jgi:hypothetical protein